MLLLFLSPDGEVEEEDNHDAKELSKRYGYSAELLMPLCSILAPLFKNHLNLTCKRQNLFGGRAKRMSLEIGPSSFASRKKKKKTSAT